MQNKRCDKQYFLSATKDDKVDVGFYLMNSFEIYQYLPIYYALIKRVMVQNLSASRLRQTWQKICLILKIQRKI